MTGLARVLLVDDDTLMLAILRKHFAHRFNLVMASSGEEALSKVQTAKQPFAVVVCDLGLPMMDGLAADVKPHQTSGRNLGQ